MVNRLITFILLLNANVLLGKLVSFEDSLSTYLNEVRHVTAAHKELWDLDLYGPILLVDEKTKNVYANEADAEGILTKRINLYTGKLPASITIANTAITWSGKRWAMIMLPLPLNKHERLSLITHELFHRAQTDLHFATVNADNKHLDKKEGRIYLRLELEALRKAIYTNNIGETKLHIENALTFRKMRQAIYPMADSTENVLELNEGIAEYTGLALSGRTTQDVALHVDKSIKEFLANKTFVRSFAYQTIPVYGYLLSNSLKKYWNKEITAQTNLSEYFKSAFGIELVPDIKAKSAAISAMYGVAQIVKEETLRDEANAMYIKTQINRFILGPHLEIPFDNMNISFDPTSISSLDEYGTVYPKINVTDTWGTLTVTNGALMSPDWSKITVTEPLDFTPKVVKGDGWVLEIKSDRYAIKKDANGNIFYLTKK